MNVTNFIRTIQKEFKDVDDLQIFAMVMMRYGGNLCGDVDNGFVIEIDGMFYDINGTFYGRAKPVKLTDEDVLDMWHDR